MVTNWDNVAREQDQEKAWAYARGIMAAQTAVAEITGKQPVGGMSDREWKLINAVHLRLANLAVAAVNECEE